MSNAKIHKIKQGLRVSNIRVSRTLKTDDGDVRIELEGAFDGEEPLTAPEEASAIYLMQMQAYLAALNSALATGSVSEDYHRDQHKAAKNRFGSLIMGALGDRK